MSTAIAIKQSDKILIGCDRQINYAGTGHKVQSTKMIQWPDVVAGISGVGDCLNWPLMNQPDYIKPNMNHWDFMSAMSRFIREQTKIQKDNDKICDSYLIIVYDKELFVFEGSYGTKIMDKWVATGSGSQYAYGALEATSQHLMKIEDRLDMALNVAAKLDKGNTGDSFEIVEIK